MKPQINKQVSKDALVLTIMNVSPLIQCGGSMLVAEH